MEAVPKQAVAPVPGGPQQQQQQQEADEAALEAGPVDDGILLARVHVPELCVSKCLQFPKDQLVWDVKQQCLASLPKVRFSLSWYFTFFLIMENSESRVGGLGSFYNGSKREL